MGEALVIEFWLFLWDRYVRRCRNIGYGWCRWGGPHCRQHRRRWSWLLHGCRILIDEGMCSGCYFNDYVENYK